MRIKETMVVSEMKPVFKFHSAKKHFELNKPTISLLGNPRFLNFVFDEPNERLIVLPAFEETLDTYEIPEYFWNNKVSCKVFRLPFFLRLKQKLNWEGDKIYKIIGIFQNLEERQKLVVFNFADAIEWVKKEKSHGYENDGSE